MSKTPGPLESVNVVATQKNDYVTYYEPDAMEYAKWGYVMATDPAKQTVTFVEDGTANVCTVEAQFITYDIEVGMD